MSIPNLAGVISKDDVFRKGSGSYAADYVSWARIANHLHTHAPGWEFHLQPAPGGGHVWAAPDGTGYVVGFFTGPNDEATSDFPFPCMDNRNQPIPLDKISCRVLTDTHRRALCAAAAFHMSLGYELWARTEIEDAAAEPAAPVEAPKVTSTKRTPPRPAPHPDLAEQPSIDAIKKTVASLPPDQRSKVVDAFKSRFNITTNAGVADYIKTNEHVAFLSVEVAQLKDASHAVAA